MKRELQWVSCRRAPDGEHRRAGNDDSFTPRQNRPHPLQPLVSVVIPTYGRPALLLRCIDALLAQSYPSMQFEIVIVDDGSPAPAREQMIEALNERRLRHRAPVLRFVSRETNAGPAAARNLGVLAARGSIIAFTDDDTVPDRDWLRAGVLAIAVAGADAVAGRVEVPLPPVPTDYERDAAGLAHAGFVTANCFVRRAVLEAIGGFDERFRCAWREDADLCFRLHASGAVVRTVRAARVVHPVRPARWGVSLAQQRKVMFDALLYKKFPRGYRRYIRPHPPWNYYAAVLAGICGLASFMLGRPPMALACLGVWLALGLAFARRRLADTSHAPRHVAEMLVTSLLIPWLSVYWRTRGALRFRVPFV